jgi:tetratricopeptide (TPR) repeat protein
MDLQTVSILLSILAVIVSIAGFIDSRRRTSIIREQAESKKELRKAMKTLSKVQELFAKINPSGYNWGNFGGAYLKILETLHNSGKTEITWSTSIADVFAKMFSASFEKCTNFELFLASFEQAVKGPKKNLNIEFLSNPRIHTNPNKETEFDYIEIGDYVSDIYSLRIAYEELNNAKKVINMYDPALPDDIKNIYLDFLKVFQERLLSRFTLQVKNDIKTKDLSNDMLGFVGFDKWLESIKELNERIVPRLYEVQKRMLEVV